MVWLKVDDGFWAHPKVVAASKSAVDLWVRAGSWSAQNLTEGRVPDAMITRLGSTRRWAEELVFVGLWEREDGAYLFHDWLDYNPSKAKVLADRAATAARVAKSRSNSRRNAVTNGVSTDAPSPVPLNQDISTSSQEPKRARDSTDDRSIEKARTSIMQGFGITNFNSIKLAIVQAAGRAVTDEQATRIVAGMLAKAESSGTKVASPQAYVLGSIRQSWPEVQQLIDEDAA